MPVQKKRTCNPSSGPRNIRTELMGGNKLNKTNTGNANRNSGLLATGTQWKRLLSPPTGRKSTCAQERRSRAHTLGESSKDTIKNSWLPALRKPQNWRRKVHAETCCVQPAATSHVVLKQDCSRLLAERRKCNKICCVIFVTDKTLMQNKVINISYYLCCCAIYTIGSSQRWYFCFVRDQSSISWKHECHESWSGDQQILLHSQKASQLATETRIKNTLE